MDSFEDDIDLEHALEIDAFLVSDYPGLVKLGNYLFLKLFADDEKRTRSPRELSKSKETLKLILINLHAAYQGSVAVRYSRRPAYYTRRNRYGKIYFKFDRVIPIIDRLLELSYLNTKKAVYDSDKDDFRRQPRIWASDNLLDLFERYGMVAAEVRKEPPSVDELIILKNAAKEPIDIDLKEQRVSIKKFNQMLGRLKRYNEFIPAHKFEVKLSGEVPVNEHFLKIFLMSHMSKGMVRITGLQTDFDVKFRFKDCELPGFEINKSKFILAPPKDKIPILPPDIKLSSLNEYYRLFVVNRFLKEPISKVKGIPDGPPTFTGRFLEFFRDKRIDTSIADNVDLGMPLSNWGIQQLDFECRYQYLHRVFNEFLDSSGGRFYDAGLIQDLPKKVRKCLYINEAPAVELDYGANHVRLLYHNRIRKDLPGDPYQDLCETPPEHAEERKLERGIYKIVMLVMINAPTPRKGIWGSIGKLAKKGYPKHIQNPAFIKYCLNRIKRYHPDLVIFLNKGFGTWLQFLEGEIIDNILAHMTAKETPCYPVHDSFLVPENHEGELCEIMASAYQEVLETEFLPVIDKQS